jgi:DNA-directed RNA polymerase subunit M/transcription elongation factor TFIIS
MKRVRCPKCEKYLSFDETKYSEGQSLVFECDECGKQFSIRIGKSKMKEMQKNEKINEDEFNDEFGALSVIENVFGRDADVRKYTETSVDVIAQVNRLPRKNCYRLRANL